jgi:hypothetical protein
MLQLQNLYNAHFNFRDIGVNKLNARDILT